MTFQRIGAGLPGLVADWIDDEEFRVAVIARAWERVAGPTIAGKARVEAVRDGTLEVVVEDPAWRAPLREMAPELLARLREALGQHAPDRIKWV